ncbi:hypothetical protein [Nocardioides gilvus]|uniref:hypothetical protein n=1 Tax=Nocardioides gilvus TaxID=1735589 RepID=UPI000D74E01C|nr:hypothetical protein [Nocardioides gilvus]
MKSRRLLVAVALFLGAAVTPWLATAPAQAAACSGSGGVTVVVDFAELGGGLTAGCDSSTGGQRARAILADAGYSLTMATKSPGFVCRVNGAPASDPCVEAAPADRYWGVWWADGKGGNWVYSSRGVDSLRVPEGGYVALAWHQGSGRSQPPATVPGSRVPKAEPTKAPKPKPTPSRASAPRQSQPKAPASSPNRGGVAASPRASADATPSAEASDGPSDAPSDGPSASPSPDSETPSPGESVEVDPGLPTADQIESGPEDVQATSATTDDGLPLWVPALVVVAVLVAAGAVVVRRRVS